MHRAGRAAAPGHAAFRAGEVLVLADAGRADEAVALGLAAVRAAPREVELRAALAYAYDVAGSPVDALAQYDAALALAPGRRDLLRGRIFAINRMGAFGAAARLAAENPGLFSAAERRALDGDAAALLVRQAGLPPATEAERHVAADRALAALDALVAELRTARPPDAAALRRARFDRIVALHARARPDEVIAEYDALRAEGVETPPFVDAAVAGALLERRQPEEALALYRSVLAREPDSFAARRGLVFALVETEQFDAAIAEADALDASVPTWIWLLGNPERQPNPLKVESEMLAVNVRLYADRLAEAEERFAAMAARAPNNGVIAEGLANTLAARGRNRAAAEELAIARALEPDDFALRLAEGRNALAMRDWRAAKAVLDELTLRRPEDPGLRRLARDWEVHQMRELRLAGGPTWRASTNPIGGSGLQVDGAVFSQPLAWDWRLYAGAGTSYEKLDPGSVTYTRVAAGVEWRTPDFTLSGEATENWYGGSRFGGRVAGAWTPGDHWRGEVAAEIFARDTPLKALDAGITANSATAGVAYRWNESRQIALAAQVYDFSDGNFRTALGLRGVQRLYASAPWTVDAALALGASHNTGGADAPYFNPKNDFAAVPELAVSQMIWRRYESSWVHRLVIAAGGYWQDGFDTGFAGEVRYEHRYRVDETLELGAGLRAGRRPYDGVAEDSYGFVLDLAWRF